MTDVISSSQTEQREVPQHDVHGLTPLQQGMVFHAARTASTGVDIEHVTFELEEALDADRLVAAWNEVSALHPTLHSHVVLEGGVAGLRFDPTATVPVTHHCWNDFDDDERNRRWRDLAASDRVRGFDLTSPPLQRLHLIEWKPGSWRGLWSFHHVLLDGRSFPLVLRDIFGLYDDGRQPAERPPVERHVETVEQHDLIGDQAFWSTELADFEPTPRLRIIDDSEAAAVRSGTIGHQLVHETRLDTGTTERIVAAAGRHGVSTNTIVQAAWAILQHRYHATNDIAFGSTRACRHVVPEADQMVGMLINTVPFRVAIDRTQPLGDLLRGVATTHRRLRQAETSPLHLIKSWTGVDPDSELFDSLVMFDEETLGRRLADLGAHRAFHYDGQTNLPVTLLVYADPQMLVRLETDPAHIGAAASERMLSQYCAVLESMASDPDQLVGTVGYLTEHDRALLQSFNATDVDYDRSQTLDSLLRAQAERTPDAVALTFGDDTLSYARTREVVESTAGWLQTRGIGPGAVVGVLAERSLEMITALHAIVAAGAAYLPLDPSLPDERLRFMVDDAGVELVLRAATDRSGLEAVATVVDVDDLSAADGQVSSRPRPEDAAYVIYTSGSSGKPKGVTNEHRGIVNRLQWMQEAFALGTDDVVLQKTPFTFDVSVWELFWPLLVGARLHIAPPGAHTEPRRLVDQITTSGTTTMHFVPSMLSVFADEPRITECTSLRRVICSGEALARDLQDRTLAALDVELHNLYGPTEAAVDVTWWACDPASPLDTVPIGRAIANTAMHVLDSELQPVPPGAVGELFIAGVQVARGYLNRPELTNERFLEHGINGVDDRRCYRTGDLGRHREDGSIEYLGRTDHQVKVRGLRIELGEIEATLTSHPSVANAAVTVREDRPGDQHLIGYVTTVGDPPTDLDQTLRSHLELTLASYMVPSHFVTLAEFPLTTSGKIDRKALPVPTLAETTTTAPVGDIEQAIATIWCELLQVDAVDRSTPFFRAGGHSLLVVRLASALSRRFDTEVEVTALIDNATIESQATLFTDGASASTATDRLSAVSNVAADRKAAASRRRRAAQRRPRRDR